MARLRKKAAAIVYDRERDNAPRVTAKGEGRRAEQILALAEAHGIPVREDPYLAELLALIDLDAEIPPGLYLAVAEVLAFVYRLNETFDPA